MRKSGRKLIICLCLAALHKLFRLNLKLEWREDSNICGKVHHFTYSMLCLSLCLSFQEITDKMFDEHEVLADYKYNLTNEDFKLKWV